jgi:transposase-like protein
MSCPECNKEGQQTLGFSNKGVRLRYYACTGCDFHWYTAFKYKTHELIIYNMDHEEITWTYTEG